MSLLEEGLIEFGRFKGLRNNVDAGNFEAADLDAAENVDIDDVGEARLRRGHAAPAIAGIAHSLWADGSVCLGVIDNALVQVFPNLTTKVLRTGLTPGERLSYETDGLRVFWTNGLENGVVADGANRSWGLEVPAQLSATLAHGGALPPGRYQFAMTFVRSDGQESGAPRAGFLELPTVGGLQFDNLPTCTDPDVVEKVLYVSKPNGEELYDVGYFPASEDSIVFSAPRWPGGPLRTQHLSAPPIGDYVGLFNGHLLVAKGNVLYPSEHYNYELFDLRLGYAFTSVITMVAPVDDGVFIGLADKVVFLSGSSPDDFVYRVKSNSGAIPGTLVFDTAEVLGSGQGDGKVAIWASTHGLCVGASGGAVVNLTEERFSYPVQPQGAGVARRWRGISQYLVTFRGAEVAPNAYA